MSVEYIIYVHSNCNYIILCTIDNRVGEPTGVIYAGGGCSRKLLGRCSAHCRGEPEQAKMAQLSCHAAAMSVVDCIASPTAVHSLHTQLENK